MKRLIIGISGASGTIYGVRPLQVLRDVTDAETHLAISAAARQTLVLEADLSVCDVQALANVSHDTRDITASIPSGPFQTAGMVILPCSIKTLSGIVHNYTDGLLTRAADVVLKEHHPSVLYVRETPLYLGHLRLMTQVAETGAVIAPPVPAFYHRPQTLDDAISQTVSCVSDQFDITLPQDLLIRWRGVQVIPSAYKESSVALLQGSFVTTIISSTLSSLKFNEALRLNRQTCYLQDQDITATFY